MLKSYALTTVQRVADYLGLGTIASGSSEETIIERLINASTEHIENYIGYRIKQTAYTNEEYDSQGAIISLNNYPVNSSETFTLQRRMSALNNDSWETVDGQLYHVDADIGIINAIRGNDFATTLKGFRVTYTAGYDYDNSATFLSDTEAGDIELACWMEVSTLYNRRRGGAGIKSEKLGDHSITYAGSMTENEDIKALLDKYVRIDLPIPMTPPNT